MDSRARYLNDLIEQLPPPGSSKPKRQSHDGRLHVRLPRCLIKVIAVAAARRGELDGGGRRDVVARVGELDGVGRHVDVRAPDVARHVVRALAAREALARVERVQHRHAVQLRRDEVERDEGRVSAGRERDVGDQVQQRCDAGEGGRDPGQMEQAADQRVRPLETRLRGVQVPRAWIPLSKCVGRQPRLHTGERDDDVRGDEADERYVARRLEAGKVLERVQVVHLHRLMLCEPHKN